jgi:SAM-dependent methyltransferase
MKNLIKKIIKILLSPFVLKDYFAFKKKTDNRFSLKFSNFYPQIKDKTIKTGFDRHYVYHTSWAARKVKKINPEKHIDISSSLYFSGIVSAFVPVDFYDYRPADLELSNLQSKEGDLMKLPFEDNSVTSLSCMHTIEHIGLGRYGDPMDPQGDLKAIKELKRVLAKNGDLLFVVPIGKEARIEFNAHRIYTYEQIIKYFEELKLVEFSLIPEHSGAIIQNADPELTKNENYACGCFWFTKLE